MYLALYRRFRPTCFEELIGQEQVAKILKNQISSGRIGHAYLFCGARGTGKTTVAKIFARAINCLAPVNGSPCGECEVCKALSGGNNMDILEMDAASNNGVDDIRDMREKIQYPPVVGKYKVYIVDEVHMLSAAAFNALLKTLEEPPSHAVFIFATTEVHKIPRTILSRCMRFDFKLVPAQDIANHLKTIFDKIGKEYEDGALSAIARAAEGSVRDALSIADACYSYSSGKLTYADVLEVLGSADADRVLKLTSEIIRGDLGGALADIDEMALLGKSMSVLADDIAATLRNLIICKTSSNAGAVLSLPKERIAEYSDMAQNADGHRLLRLIEIFTSLDNAFRYSIHPRIVLETAAVRAARKDEDYNIDALLSRMTSLEKQLEELKSALEKSPARIPLAPEISKAPKAEEGVGAPQEVAYITQKRDVLREEGFTPPPEEFYAPPEPAADEARPRSAPESINPVPDDDKVPPAKLWGNVLRLLRTNGNAVLWTVCRDVTAKVEGGVLHIFVNDDGEYAMFTKETHFKTLSDAAKKFGNYSVAIEPPANQNTRGDFERDVRELKDIFGADAVKIIKD